MNKNLLLLPVLLMPHVSKGALIASDAFDYAAGALATQNGGTGFSGGWGNQVAATVNATGLNYSGLATSGRSANLSGDGVSIFRGLTTAGGGSGTNVWMSFLIESAGGNAGISYFDGGNEQTFAGRVGGNGINGFGTLFYKGAGRPIVDAAAGNLGDSFHTGFQRYQFPYVRVANRSDGSHPGVQRLARSGCRGSWNRSRTHERQHVHGEYRHPVFQLYPAPDGTFFRCRCQC